MSILRENLCELLQVMRINPPFEEALQQTNKYWYLKDKPVAPEQLQMMSEPGKKHNRVFVVVMDYDPQSLCITGHPELELSVLSGTYID